MPHAVGSPGFIECFSRVRLRTIGWLMAASVVLLACTAYGASGDLSPAVPVASELEANGEQRYSSHNHVRYAQARDKKYHWLFREPRREKTPVPVTKTTDLQELDREIKQARKLYLSGETDNAVLKYRSAIDQFESMLGGIPPGHPLLTEMEQRFPIYGELATKILGPLHLEPKEEVSGQVFHLMEKRRICRRNITLKKAGILKFSDVPERLLVEESDILGKLIQIRSSLPTAESRRTETELKTRLDLVRRSLQKSSKRFTMLRRGVPLTLDELRTSLLGDDEIILDFNLFQDRLVVGIITKAKGIYCQVPAERAVIDKAVFTLQDKLREFTYGARSTFMGHAWKEPCRRIYRALLGKLPALPRNKSTVLVIPDRSLWYLPMSAMLDPEDRPFGADRLITLIPSADMLKFVRAFGRTYNRTVFGTDLLAFESIPWVPEEEIRQEKGTRRPERRMSEGEKIEQLIMTNPVYPKPSEIIVTIQRMFKKSDVLVGPTATVERVQEYTKRSAQVSLLGVPFAMIDSVRPHRQPCFFFSPDKRGRRRFEAGRLFAEPLKSGLLAMPVSWFDVANREEPVGEGPILLSTAMYYSGVRMGLINYSDPNWGSDEPFLLSVLKKISEKAPLGTALTGYARELPTGLDSSFRGKPPSWTGWILMGDPGK